LKINFNFNHWEPLYTGDIIEVENPEIFIYKRQRFMVENTTINQNQDGRSMSLTAVLPESFTGDQPKNIFEF